MPVLGAQEEPDPVASLPERTNLQPRTPDAPATCYEDVLTGVSNGWGRSRERAQLRFPEGRTLGHDPTSSAKVTESGVGERQEGGANQACSTACADTGRGWGWGGEAAGGSPGRITPYTSRESGLSDTGRHPGL